MSDELVPTREATDEDLKRMAMALVVNGLGMFLDDKRAVNFVTMHCTSRDHGQIEVTVRRAEGKTPGQVMAEQAAEIEQLKAALDARGYTY